MVDKSVVLVVDKGTLRLDVARKRLLSAGATTSFTTYKIFDVERQLTDCGFQVFNPARLEVAFAQLLGLSIIYPL